jgi:hypothetical protein
MGMNPNVALIGAAITVLGLIFAIFGAQWLNLRSIERLFEQLDKRMDDRFATVNQRFVAVDQRFIAVDQRFAAIEQRLDRIERQLEAIFKPMLPSRQ